MILSLPATATFSRRLGHEPIRIDQDIEGRVQIFSVLWAWKTGSAPKLSGVDEIKAILQEPPGDGHGISLNLGQRRLCEHAL